MVRRRQQQHWRGGRLKDCALVWALLVACTCDKAAVALQVPTPGLELSRADALLRAPRLYLPSDLSTNGLVPLSEEQARYLGTVIRLRLGSTVRAFNGRHGEYLCTLQVRFCYYM
jgi:hypothetical protein